MEHACMRQLTVARSRVLREDTESCTVAAAAANLLLRRRLSAHKRRWQRLTPAGLCSPVLFAWRLVITNPAAASAAAHACGGGLAGCIPLAQGCSNRCIGGYPLSRQPLAKRTSIKNHTVKISNCNAMIRKWVYEPIKFALCLALFWL